MRLKNKIALVTGASGGIGGAIVLELAKEGADIILHYHQDEPAANEVADSIRKYNVKIHILRATLEFSDEAIALGERAWNLYGRIDFLINNSGVSYKKHF